MFGLYDVRDKALDLLSLTEPEFDFIEGVESSNLVEEYATDVDIFDLIRETQSTVLQHAYDVSHKKSTAQSVVSPAAKFADWIYKSTKPTPPTRKGATWPWVWPLCHFVWKAPEGAGKSSIVNELVARGFKVVFCSKTNDQLVEQYSSFKQRWPHLVVERRVSRGRHLQEQLKLHYDIDFELKYYESTSPYSSGMIDEAGTRQALRKALDDAGHAQVDHWPLYDAWFANYKPPKIAGWQTDVLMLTLDAFQGACTARHATWWGVLGLVDPEKKRTVVRKGKEKTLPVGLPNIIVVIDDPSWSDFDFKRYVDDEAAVKLHNAQKKLNESEQRWCTEQYWLEQGFGPLTAAETAKYHREKARAHSVVESQGYYFESRPQIQKIGYGLHRGFETSFMMYGTKTPKSIPICTIPKILVTTTENVTAQLARKSIASALGYEKAMPLYGKFPSRVTDECHVTLLSTPITRKANHALLLIIIEKLKREFPKDYVTFIGDGLAADLNLSNNKGRNDLADRTTVIKLSVPNATLAINLWAQFPETSSKRELNTLLLSDLANQAIGRNQGYRFRGKPCVLLVDPLYASGLVSSGGLRYRRTPWSFMGPEQAALPIHYDITPFEARLMELIELPNARRLAMSIEGMRLGYELPEKQRAHYEAWCKKENFVLPWCANA